jgi:predicted phage terminase large subunit-like protein
MAMLALRDHWADDVFEAPPLPVEETADDEAPRHPLHRPDGSPIGLRAYCELVTPSYRWDWAHLRYIDSVLDRVTAGELKRVIIELPPRHGKTEKATIRQTSYRLELNPALRVIIAAYNAKFAQKLSRKIRRIVRGRIALSEDRNAAEDWETTEGGGVRALGAGEGTAGLPAELLLIDDPIKNRKQANSKTFRDSLWEWMTEDLFTRLEPNAAVVLTMTRRHEDDPVGRILASEEAKDWTVIKLPALAEENDPLGRKVDEALCPDRYDADALKKIRRGNERMFASLYQQRPAPASGLVFKGEWWQYYTTRDRPIIENGHAVHVLPEVFSSHLQSWDLSFKNKDSSDKVSGQVWSRLGANVYLRDRVNDRMDFVATIKAIRALTKKWPMAMLKLVEDKANGPAVISALRNEIPGLVAVEPNGDKVSRAYAVTPMYEAGNIWLPHPQIAPWIEVWKLEHIQFPLGANDDDVDSGTQALDRMWKQINGEPDPQAENEKVVYSEAVLVANERF